MTKLGINPGAVIFQLKVSLCGINPVIWRRLLVPGNIRLDILHETIQGAFGWKDEHLHEYIINGITYGDPDNPPADSFVSERGTKSKLKFLGIKADDKFFYRYDFGDDWLHEVLVEQILEPVPKVTYPQLIAGERACPPEDCGGLPGYEHLLQAWQNQSNPEYKELLNWVGKDFNPEEFDIKTHRWIPIMLTYS
jgi:hypothetical protein